MAATKRIGILTSGGDCAGLNAVIRAVVYRAVGTYGWEVVGINEGTRGLMDRPLRFRTLTPALMDGNTLRQGGTILGTTNKGNPFAFPEAGGKVTDRSGEVIAGWRELGLEAMIAVGGDGSLEIMRGLAQKGGLNLVAIPKTIDNDVDTTDMSIGFQTAVDVATEALDRLQPTAASHHRVMILEVMGRDAGHIAMSAGIAGGADVILIPEIPWKLASIAAKIEAMKRGGRTFGLVVVAEAVSTEAGKKAMVNYGIGAASYGGIGHYLAGRITEATGAETRVTVLGHVQRGGQPTANDRVLAAALGVHAVDMIAAGKFDRMAAWQNREAVDVPIKDAIAANRQVDVDGTLVCTARGLGICLGD